jgi:hypothetical protein
VERRREDCESIAEEINLGMRTVRTTTIIGRQSSHRQPVARYF